MAKNNPTPRVTLKMLADQLGLSPTTVSLVVNGSKGSARISEDTRQRVLAACREANYIPNYFAQRLKQDRTMQVAMAVSTLYDQFTPPLIDGVKSVMLQNGYNLIIMDFNPDRFYESVDAIHQPLMTLLGGAIDGIISHIGHKPITDLVQNMVPIVHIDDVVESAPCVSADTERAMYLITELFLKRGCRRIAFIGARNRGNFSYTFYARQCGYEKALIDYQMAVDPSLETFVAPSFEGGFEAFNWLIHLNPLPEAVVVYTDIVAHIVHAKLIQSQIKIPQQIGIASIDDTFQSALLSPPLTSVHIPAYEMGVQAAKLMLDSINGKETSGINHVVDIVLNERESSNVNISSL